MTELRPQVLETQEVGVQTATSYLVATGLGNDGFSHASQQRTDHHDGAAQLGTLVDKLVALQVLQVELVRLEREGTLARALAFYLLHLDTDVAEQLDEVVDVADVGDVANDHLVAGQQRGTNHLQRLVLGALWRNGATEQMPAFYSE